MNLHGSYTLGHFCPDWVDGVWWRLRQDPLKPWGFNCTDGAGCWLIVPPDGFYTDFASVPRIARVLLPQAGDGVKGQYGPAAGLHDYLYTYGKALLRFGATYTKVDISREFADHVFRAAMIADNVSTWRVAILFSAVRIGGGKYFKSPHKYNNFPIVEAK